jgi:hypothetical protein
MTDEWVVAIIGGSTVNTARATEWLDSWLPAADLTIYVPDLHDALTPSEVADWFDYVNQDYRKVAFNKIALLLVQAKLAGKKTYLVLYDDKPKYQRITDLYNAAVLADIEVRNLDKAGMPFPQMPLGGSESHAESLVGTPGYPDEGTGDDLVTFGLRDAPITATGTADCLMYLQRAMEYWNNLRRTEMPGAFAAETPIRSESVEPLAEIQEKKKYWKNSAGKYRLAGKSQPKGKETEVWLTDSEWVPYQAGE